MRQRKVIGVGLLGLVLLVAACGGDDDAGEEDATSVAAQQAILASQGVFTDDPDEVRYLSAIDQAWDEFAGANAAVIQDRLESDPDDADRAALFASLLDRGLDTAFASVRAAAAAIDPPTGYEADFATFNAYLSETVAVDVRVSAAAEAEDLVALALANADLEFAGVRARGRLAPTTCRLIFADCPAPEPTNAGIYERALRLEIDELTGGLRSLNQIFGQPMMALGVELSVGEDLEYSAGMIERGLTLIDVTRVAVDSVEPTARYAADHDLIGVFIEQAAAILTEAQDAIEVGDWRAGGRDQLLGGRLLASICQTIETLSDAALAISGFEVPLGADDENLCESGFPSPAG